jgi:hypothetical protein
MITIFTGMPGVNIKGSLEKVRDFLKKSGTSDDKLPKLLDLDKKLRSISEPKIKEILETEPDDRTWLRLPHPVLEELWEEAFREIIKEAAAREKEGLDSYIHFHACYYHHQTRGFISAASYRLIGEAPKGSCLITLIDDVFDIYDRLVQPDRVYDFTWTDSPFVDMIFKFLHALQWRNVETCMSDRIAKSWGNSQKASDSGIPHYVFAVKHPIATLVKLIKKKTGDLAVYLSHPITYIREVLDVRRSGSIADMQRRKDEIEKLSLSLREKFILFEPTTIDELRFYNRNLGRHWIYPLNADEVLFCPPTYDAKRKPSRDEFNTLAYSEPSRAVIPTEAGHPFRLMAGTDSDLKAGSFSRFSE